MRSPQSSRARSSTAASSSARWPIGSASITTPPRRANACATALLPLPMPPTRPMTGFAILCEAASGLVYLVHIQPVRPDADINLEGNVELHRADHFLAYQRGDRLHFAGRDLENQLIVDRQQHLRLPLLFLEPPADVQHGELHQVGGRALNLHVDRFALDLVAAVIAAVRADRPHLERPPPAEDRTDVARLAALLQEVLLVLQYLGVAREILGDEALRLRAANLEALGQAVRTHAVEHAEVDRLGYAPLGRSHFPLVALVNLRRHGVVDVAVLGEGALQDLVAGKLGEQAQFNLRIVG